MTAYLIERERDGLRRRTLEQYQQHLARLTSALPGARVQDVTAERLLQWLSAEGIAGRTRANYRTSLGAFFAWAVRLGYCRGNAAGAIGAPRRDETIPGILTVQQTTALLDAAEAGEPAVVPYLALGLFAGIRPAELALLDWGDVHADHVLIGPTVAKTRQQRLVEHTPNLPAWIARYRAKGPVLTLSPWKLYKSLGRAATAAEMRLPHNAARHSFASYHLALYQDAPRTAHQLGHRAPDMLYRHYRALAERADADAYFALTPGA